MKFELHLGDCAEVLKTLPDNSVDSIVTDPPYGLSKEPNMEEVMRHWMNGDDYKHKGSGFMGKTWDSFVPGPSVWRECFRVLKPGGHLLSFFGSRTYDMGTLAIRLAGFEIRDQIMWLYGAGFPKSHDVSKAIDKVAPRLEMFTPFAKHYAQQRAAKGMTHAAICEAGKFYDNHNHGGASVNWEKGHNVPTLAQWKVLQPLLDLSLEWLPLIQRIEAEREIVEQKRTGDPFAWYAESQRGDGVFDITAPATDAARQWQGWGTALKPAHEPVCVARKPLVGTVAANVLEYGTGAINIDGCRVGTEVLPSMTAGQAKIGTFERSTMVTPERIGRWPANVIHDGLDEEWARYFYCAKASKRDRGDGNTHPTVKPTDLMRYLVRLVTPPNGIVLDPFMGSGSTGKAAMLEDFRFIGIDLTPEYVEIARARIQSAIKPKAFATEDCQLGLF